MTKPDLKDLRGRIDEIDSRLISLFCERMRTVEQVAAYKKEAGLTTLDPVREKEILDRASALAGEELAPYARELYRTLLSLSRAWQEASRTSVREET